MQLHANSAKYRCKGFSKYLITQITLDTSSVVHLLASRALISSIRPPPPGKGPFPRAASGLVPPEFATPPTGGVGGSSVYSNKRSFLIVYALHLFLCNLIQGILNRNSIYNFLFLIHRFKSHNETSLPDNKKLASGSTKASKHHL